MEDVYTAEMFRTIARVVGFAIAVVVVAFVLDYLGLMPRKAFVSSMLESDVVASIAR